MYSAPLPDNETERLKVLNLYQILDTASEGAFDEITSQAASHFQVPIALISLVDANRQWFKSCVGLSVNHTGRDESFCAYTILDNKPFIIPDTLLDARFTDNPLVTGEPYVRFYAGAPLITPDGYALGTICLLDRQPRVFSSSDVRTLTLIARAVVTRLNLRLASLNLEKANSLLNASS